MTHMLCGITEVLAQQHWRWRRLSHQWEIESSKHDMVEYRYPMVLFVYETAYYRQDYLWHRLGNQYIQWRFCNVCYCGTT